MKHLFYRTDFQLPVRLCYQHLHNCEKQKVFDFLYTSLVFVVAEVFGRVLVLTTRGVIKYERRRREPLGGLGACPQENFEI